jgi:predicted dehydrogenase
MFNISIVGAGQLGSRHLQALKKITLPVNLYVIDPDLIALTTTRERYSQVSDNINVKLILFSQSLEILPGQIDLCIIATNSKNRSEIIKQIVNKTIVKHFLIEKVLFQSISEYDEVERIFENRNIKSWVNCPRRLLPVYRNLKNWIDQSDQYFCTVDGGNWGLGCNSIHFIDLFNFLTSTKKYKVNTDGLNRNIINSKRAGYNEFTGIIRLEYENGNHLNIISRLNSHAPVLITITSDKIQIVIDEKSRKLRYSKESNEWQWEELTFDFPFQSELTHLVAEDILIKGVCNLTPYKTSADLHKPFIKQLIKFINSINNTQINYCSIT